jgi:hypothetical protein
MRLSTIAVCLLVLSPCPAFGCIEHEAQQTGWFHEMPSSYASSAGKGAEASGMLGLWLLGAGSASVALVVVSFRAFSLAAGRARVQPAGFDEDQVRECESPGLGRVLRGLNAVSPSLITGSSS